jgi:hypothetical protein
MELQVVSGEFKLVAVLIFQAGEGSVVDEKAETDKAVKPAEILLEESEGTR